MSVTARGPSPHLTWRELACKDGTPYPHEWRNSRAVQLAAAFEALRAHIGNKPLAVLSGYRSPAHNARVPGAARNSQHVQGRALDLKPPKGWTVHALAEAARRVPAIRGIGYYATFVHIDVRPATRLAVWHGSRAVADAPRST